MTLRGKSILIFTLISLVYTGLLIGFMFYFTTTTLNLWENEEIEKGLVIGVKQAENSEEKMQAEKALRTYRQLKGLKGLFEWQIVGFSVVIGVIFFLVSVTIIYFVLFRITKPLNELARALSKTGEGYLDIKIPKPNTEIAQVISAYNDMTDQLKISREKLKQAERVAAWRDAARIMAHEVRNPLTGMRLSIERLIKRHENKDKDLHEVLEKSSKMILNEITTLENLAKQFSDFARLPTPSLKPTNLNKLVEGLTIYYEEYAKEVEMKRDLDPLIGDVPLDKKLMRQVLLNLLKNALEAFADNKGTITIRTKKEENKVFILFEDNGPGIEPEKLEKVFNPYFTTKEKGSGLGLAVVKQIVNEHGGEVVIESEVGKGTKFMIVLPFNNDKLDDTGEVNGKNIDN